MPIVQVIIDRSTPMVIAGLYEFDRDAGGVLVAPAGESFPGTPMAGEIFWRTDEATLYRRNAGNTDWEAMTAVAGPHAASHEADGYDEIDVTGLLGTLADPQIPVQHALISSYHSGLDILDSYATEVEFSDHSTRHENGGADEISVAGLSGTLADPQTPVQHALISSYHSGFDILDSYATSAEFDDHSARHENGGADEISVGGLSGTLADPQVPIQHGLVSSYHSGLAVLDSYATEAEFSDHSARHENGGADEISVAGLGGTLADPQIPVQHSLTGSYHSGLDVLDGYATSAEFDDHSARHENGGADEISVGGLSGTLADPQTPVQHGLISSYHSGLSVLDSYATEAEFSDHSARHENGGADEVSVAGLSGVLADKQDADKLQSRTVASAAPSDGYALVWNQSANQWEPQEQAGSIGDDKKVKVSANDTTAGYLNGKLTAGTFITLIEQNDGGNENLQVNVDHHASSHENGGADEMSVAGLSGTLADPQAPVQHSLTGSYHSGFDVLDSYATEAEFSDHSSRHENGGADEISVGGLSGTLADPQTPIQHALISSYHSGLDVLDGYAALIHASQHQHGGSDEVATATPGANAIPKAGSGGTLNAGWVPDGADATAIHDNVSGEISAITEKASPVSADLLIIEDSQASNAKKRVQVGNLPGGSGSDPHAIHDNEASEISAITLKKTPKDGDFIIIEDSEDSENKKSVRLGLVGDGYHADAQMGSFLTTTSTSYQSALTLLAYMPACKAMIHCALQMSSDIGNPSYAAMGDFYDNAGGLDITSGAAVPLDTERQKTSDFSHSTTVSNSEVTINETGTYRVTYTTSMTVGAGNKSAFGHARLEKNTGSGFTEIDGTRSFFALSQGGSNSDSNSRTVILSLNSSDVLRVYAQRDSGNTPINLIADGSGLVIEKANSTKIGLVKFRLLVDGVAYWDAPCAIPFGGNYESIAFSIPYTFTTAGDKTLELVYACTGIGGTAYIKSGKISLHVAEHA